MVIIILKYILDDLLIIIMAIINHIIIDPNSHLNHIDALIRINIMIRTGIYI